MKKIRAYTLIDITETKYIYARDANKPEYLQMQNLQSLLQAISMRTQPLEPVVEQLENQDLQNYEFDCNIHGHHTVWKLTFGYEYGGAWDDGTDELGFLKDDIYGIAFSSGLQNTAKFEANIFDTKDKVNLYFEHDDTDGTERTPSDTP